MIDDEFEQVIDWFDNYNKKLEIRLVEQKCGKCGGSLMYLDTFKNNWDVSFDPFTDEITKIPVVHMCTAWACRSCDRIYQNYDNEIKITDITDNVRSVKEIE